MKDLLISIVVVFVLIMGGALIFYFVNPEIMANDDEPTTTTLNATEEGYTQVSKDNNYIAYAINRDIDNDFSIKVNDTTIKYENENIKINDKVVASKVVISRDFAIYLDRTLVISYKIANSFKGGIVIYDIFDKSIEVLDVVEKMFVTMSNGLIFSDNGFSFDVTNVNGKYFYGVDQTYDMCLVVYDDLGNPIAFDYPEDGIVRENVFYKYDPNEKKFNYFEVLHFLDYSSYKATNNICEG